MVKIVTDLSATRHFMRYEDRYRKNDVDQHYRKFCCRQYCLWGEQNRSSGSGDMGKKSGQNNRNANILSNMKDRQFDPKTKLYEMLWRTRVAPEGEGALIILR